LYGTSIGDDGLLVLRRLKALKKVFLWETQVTKDAVSELYGSIFPAVKSDRLRMQIQELEKDRDSLSVDIVSAFDFEIQALKEVKPAAAKSETSISDVMLALHKGDDSLAVQAREGKVAQDDLKRMLASYQAIHGLTPPKGTLESWKLKTTALIDSTQGLIDDKDGAAGVYKTAVNCKACHSEHRTD
jgi:hypothetical protein